MEDEIKLENRFSFKIGQEAYNKGLEKSRNPHFKDSDFYRHWNAGWESRDEQQENAYTKGLDNE